jgi:hypothetical protein
MIGIGTFGWQSITLCSPVLVRGASDFVCRKCTDSMDKYTYCFGCDGEFEASDGIASAKRSSYFDLVDDPDVSSEDLPKIKHFCVWKNKPLTTPLCWDCALFRVLGYSMKYDDKRND